MLPIRSFSTLWPSFRSSRRTRLSSSLQIIRPTSEVHRRTVHFDRSRTRPIFFPSSRSLSAAPKTSPLSTTASTVQLFEDHLELRFRGASDAGVDTLEQRFEDPLRLHFVWLRDHCRCERCFNAATQQRSLEIEDVDVNGRPEDVKIVEDKDGVETLTLTWSDGHVTSLPFSFLLRFGRRHAPTKPEVTWEARRWEESALPVVDFESFMESEGGLRSHLDNLVRFGFSIVEGAEASPAGTRLVSERLCFIQPTTFGDIWTFTADMKRGDTAYTNLALGSHNDSTYLGYATGIQVFHVMFHDGAGGQTTLVDGFRAAERLKESAPSHYAALASLPIGAEYRDAEADLRSMDRVLVEDPVDGRLERVRFNIYDRSPMNSVPFSEVPIFYRALQSLSSIIKDPEMVLEVPLKPGWILFVDNWRVLHGRRSFDGKRIVSGCYLPRDDWRSRARMSGCSV